MVACVVDTVVGALVVVGVVVCGAATVIGRAVVTVKNPNGGLEENTGGGCGGRKRGAKRARNG